GARPMRMLVTVAKGSGLRSLRDQLKSASDGAEYGSFCTRLVNWGFGVLAKEADNVRTPVAGRGQVVKRENAPLRTPLEPDRPPLVRGQPKAPIVNAEDSGDVAKPGPLRGCENRC